MMWEPRRNEDNASRGRKVKTEGRITHSEPLTGGSRNRWSAAEKAAGINKLYHNGNVKDCRAIPGALAQARAASWAK
jgi:hypothetical protein